MGLLRTAYNTYDGKYVSCISRATCAIISVQKAASPWRRMKSAISRPAGSAWAAYGAQIPFKSSNYPRSSFRAESFLKIDFSRTQPEIQSASLHHSKSRFNIRNRTFTFEIAPPTFEITLQHSKSRFSIQNRASTLGITQQHSESHFQHQETRFQHAETPIQHSETPFQHSETPFQHSETPKVSNFVIQIVSILE